MLDAVVTVRLAAAERDRLAQRAVHAGKKFSQFAREMLTAAPITPPSAAGISAPSTMSAPIAWMFWDTGQVGGALTLRSTTP